MSNRRLIFTADAQLAILPHADGKPVTLTGYALVWNSLSVDRGGYKVRLLPGSATFATPTMALWHHEWRDVLANTANGTLRILPDDYGVKVEIDLANTNAGRDVAELVRRGDVRGMSFAMVDDPKATTKKENGLTVIEATAFVVDEVTVTAVPAFPASVVDVKTEPPAEPPSAPLYAARTAQSLTLDRLRLDLYRLTGAEFPGPAV